MTNQIIKIHNVETGEIHERGLNSQELAQWELDQAKLQTQREAEATKAAEKAAAIGKLAALGLTTDDLTALGLGAN
jgi:hypothetical protein